MSQHLGALALLVADYDEAIAFFTQGLGFELLEDTPLDEPGKPGKRWVRVAPKGAPGSALLLARAANEEQRAAIAEFFDRLAAEHERLHYEEDSSGAVSGAADDNDKKEVLAA